MNTLPIVESYWVKDGQFLAGEYPGSFEPEDARKRLEKFIETGIRTFIDLTQPHELVPYEPILKDIAKIYDVQPAYHRFAIRDHGVPSEKTMERILDTIDEAIENGNPAYVHCWGGIGRTGTVVGCYLVRHGVAPDKALQQVNALYRTRPANFFMPTSPETYEQMEFIRNWREASEAGHRSQPRYCEG